MKEGYWILSCSNRRHLSGPDLGPCQALGGGGVGSLCIFHAWFPWPSCCARRSGAHSVTMSWQNLLCSKCVPSRDESLIHCHFCHENMSRWEKSCLEWTSHIKNVRMEFASSCGSYKNRLHSSARELATNGIDRIPLNAVLPLRWEPWRSLRASGNRSQEQSPRRDAWKSLQATLWLLDITRPISSVKSTLLPGGGHPDPWAWLQKGHRQINLSCLPHPWGHSEKCMEYLYSCKC